MARIELRHATVRLKSGFSGSAAVNESVASPGIGTNEIDIDNVEVNGVLGTDVVPIGARFTVATVANAFPTPAVTTSQEGGGGNDETQVIAQYVNVPTGGTWTLTIDLAVEDPFTTDPIAYDANAATIEAAIDAAATAASVVSWTNGDISVTGGPLTSGDVTLTFDGTSVADADHDLSSVDGAGLTLGNEGTQVFTVTARTPSDGQSTTTNIAFAPAFSSDAIDDDDVITFLSQQLEVTVGDGNLTFTENRTYEYELDRGDLDTVRETDQVPMDVTLDMVWEFLKTGTGESVTPYDALHQEGGAAEWPSSSDDSCEPFAIDIEVEYSPACNSGSVEDEIYLFPDFRADTIEGDIREATISASGRCNAVKPILTRV